MNSYFSRLLFCLVLIILFARCGKKSEETAAVEYATTPVAGKISGVAWAFASGRVVVPSGADAAEKYTFSLISQKNDNPCEDFILSSDDKKLITFSYSKLEKGEVQLGVAASGAMQTMTFFDNSTDKNINNISTCGKWFIDKIESSSVSGKIYSTSGSDNEVNGTFAVTKCCHKSSSDFTYEICSE